MDAMHGNSGLTTEPSRRPAIPAQSRVRLRDEFEALGLLLGILGVILLLVTVGSTARFGP
jgi:hypothetical protein